MINTWTNYLIHQTNLHPWTIDDPTPLSDCKCFNIKDFFESKKSCDDPNPDQNHFSYLPPPPSADQKQEQKQKKAKLFN